MIDTDKYGMTYEELLERFSNLSVDDYKELLAEIQRCRMIATQCLVAIDVGGDIRSGTLEMIELNMKILLGEE